MSSDSLDSVSSSPPLADVDTASVAESKLFSPGRPGSADLRQSGNRKEKEKEEKIVEQHKETMIIHKTMVGAILGPRGQRNKRIRIKSQAYIDIGDANDKAERMITTQCQFGEV